MDRTEQMVEVMQKITEDDIFKPYSKEEHDKKFPKKKFLVKYDWSSQQIEASGYIFALDLDEAEEKANTMEVDEWIEEPEQGYQPNVTVTEVEESKKGKKKAKESVNEDDIFKPYSKEEMGKIKPTLPRVVKRALVEYFLDHLDDSFMDEINKLSTASVEENQLFTTDTSSAEDFVEEEIVPILYRNITNMERQLRQKLDFFLRREE